MVRKSNVNIIIFSFLVTTGLQQSVTIHNIIYGMWYTYLI